MATTADTRQIPVNLGQLPGHKREALLLLLTGLGCVEREDAPIHIVDGWKGCAAAARRPWVIALAEAGDGLAMARCVRGGAADLLLWPVVREELRAALHRAMAALEEQERRARDAREQESLQERYRSFAAAQLFRELAHQRGPDTLRQCLELLGLPCCQCYLLLFRTGPGKPPRISRLLAGYAEQCGVTALAGEWEDLSVVLAFNPHPLEGVLGEMNRDNLALRLQGCLRAVCHSPPALGRGRICGDPDGLPDSWVDALAELEPAETAGQAAEFPHAAVAQLCDHIRQGNVQKAERCARELCRAVIGGARALEAAASQLLETLVIVNHRLCLSGEPAAQPPPLSREAGRLRQVDSAAGLEAFLAAYARETARQVHRLGMDEREPIVRAVDHIRRYYSEELTLEEVAGRVSLSPYYFSKLFKRHTGEKFIDYLTSVRLAKGIELLADKSNTVQQVCFAVGYADPNYFSKLFKNHYGVSPSRLQKHVDLLAAGE